MTIIKDITGGCALLLSLESLGFGLSAYVKYTSKSSEADTRRKRYFLVQENCKLQSLK